MSELNTWGVEVARPSTCNLNGCLYFNKCPRCLQFVLIVFKGKKKPLKAYTYGGAKQKNLMEQGWSGKKLFCELLRILRLLEISILWFMVWFLILFVVLSWNDLWFSVCASKWGTRCSSQKWFHHVPAVLVLALMAAAVPPFGILQLPGGGDTSTTPAWELWGECNAGVSYSLSTHPRNTGQWK